MSIKIMSAIFESETLGPTERLILLALADHADDTGRCYPSIARLCQRTGLKERAMQGNIKSLVAQGYVTVIPNAGQGLSNVYFVRATPAVDAPPQQMHPRTKRHQTPAFNADTPAANAPKPSITIIEPEEAYASLSSGNDETGNLPRSSGASLDLQEAFNAYNIAASESGWPQAQTLNKSRKAGIAARLRECGGLDGWRIALSKAQASAHCCGQNQRGWRADLDFLIQAQSFTRLMEGSYDNRPSQSAQHARPAGGSAHRPDPALENIARIIRNRQARSDGRG